jgi:ankyrin repeat protein
MPHQPLAWQEPSRGTFICFAKLTGKRNALGGAQVQALVEAGAELDVRDRWSLDPLDEAMRERREPVVKFLQDGGALIGGRN